MSFNGMGTAVQIVASGSMRHSPQNVVQCPQMNVVADGMTELGEYILSLCERRNLSMRVAEIDNRNSSTSGFRLDAGAVLVYDDNRGPR